MDSFNIFSLIARRWMTILAITMVVFLAALLSSKSRPASFTTSLPVSAIPQRQIPVGTTLLQDSLGTDTALLGKLVAAWVTDPSVGKAVYDNANLSPSDASLRGFTKVLRVAGDGAEQGFLDIQFTGANSREAGKLTDSLEKVLTAQADRYNAVQGDGLKIALSYGTPLTTDLATSLPLTPIAGLLAGFILALVVASMQER